MRKITDEVLAGPLRNAALGPRVQADQLVYARRREWSTWWGGVDLFKLKELIVEEIRLAIEFERES